MIVKEQLIGTNDYGIYTTENLYYSQDSYNWQDVCVRTLEGTRGEWTTLSRYWQDIKINI